MSKICYEYFPWEDTVINLSIVSGKSYSVKKGQLREDVEDIKYKNKPTKRVTK